MSLASMGNLVRENVQRVPLHIAFQSILSDDDCQYAVITFESAHDAAQAEADLTSSAVTELLGDVTLCDPPPSITAIHLARILSTFLPPNTSADTSHPLHCVLRDCDHYSVTGKPTLSSLQTVADHIIHFHPEVVSLVTAGLTPQTKEWKTLLGWHRCPNTLCHKFFIVSADYGTHVASCAHTPPHALPPLQVADTHPILDMVVDAVNDMPTIPESPHTTPPAPILQEAPTNNIPNDNAAMVKGTSESQAEYFTQPAEDTGIMDIGTSILGETNSPSFTVDVDYAFALMVVPNELHTLFLAEMRKNNTSAEDALLQSMKWSTHAHPSQLSL